MSSWTLNGYLWVLRELGHKHIAYQAIQSYDKLWGKEKKSTVIQMNKYIRVFLKDSALINAAIPTQSYHHSKYVKNIWQFYIPPVLSKKWQPEWSFKGSSRLNVFWCHSILKRLTAKRLTVWVLEQEWSLMCCIYDSVATSTLGKWSRNLNLFIELKEINQSILGSVISRTFLSISILCLISLTFGVWRPSITLKTNTVSICEIPEERWNPYHCDFKRRTVFWTVLT